MDHGYYGDEVASWCQAIDQLHDYAMRHTYSPREVEHAVGTEMSRWGYMAAPLPVLQMMVRAVESGYAFALRDVRDGAYDRDIAQWRPGLGRTR